VDEQARAGKAGKATKGNMLSNVGRQEQEERGLRCEDWKRQDSALHCRIYNWNSFRNTLWLQMWHSLGSRRWNCERDYMGLAIKEGNARGNGCCSDNNWRYNWSKH
jgi:hypothetical protein